MMALTARALYSAGARATRHTVARRAMSTYFLESHEWIKVSGSTATVGITDFAQNALGEIVYVELPEVGAAIAQVGERVSK